MITINGWEIDKCKITYPNGEIGYIVDCSCEDCIPTIYYVYDPSRVQEDMVDLYFISCHLKENRIKPHLVMSYVPFSRMDRVKEYREVFTLKHFAKFINSLDFEDIEILDPHSDVSCALFNNVEVCYPEKEIRSLYHKTRADFLCYPDSGALKKYSSIFTKFPYIYGVKNRDWKTGKITSFEVNTCGNNVKDKIILIVDDICSKGGTFLATAKQLKELGAKAVYLFVSHCELSVFKGTILDEKSAVDKVFFKNSLFDWKNLKKYGIIYSEFVDFSKLVRYSYNEDSKSFNCCSK